MTDSWKPVQAVALVFCAIFLFACSRSLHGIHLAAIGMRENLYRIETQIIETRSGLSRIESAIDPCAGSSGTPGSSLAMGTRVLCWTDSNGKMHRENRE